MKKILLCFAVVFICQGSQATTVNIDWLMDGSTYAQTTCETGGNFSLPTTTPTKYGYHFVGWQQNDVIGSWSQSGTPTPDNPIEPTFRQFGNTVLRAIGSGDNFIADSYDPTTGKITRRIGVKVFNGTENWVKESYEVDHYRFTIEISDYAIPLAYNTRNRLLCNFYKSNQVPVNFLAYSASYPYGLSGYQNTRLWYFYNKDFDNAQSTIIDWKSYLASQYANGTPVTVYYPLATPVEETYSAQ